MASTSGTLVAASIGSVRDLTGLGRTHRSAFVKTPVEGPVVVGPLGLEGDEQAYHDHGGLDQALLAYSADHYPFWRETLSLDLGEGGAMAENLTFEGLTEEDVHIGDAFSIGEVVVQVTSPRSPCFKLGARYETKELPRLVQETCRTGYLMRVLQTGTVEAGQPVELSDRPEGSITVFEAARVVNRDRDDWDTIEQLIEAPGLATSMRDKLVARLERRRRGEDADRLYGEGEGIPAG